MRYEHIPKLQGHMIHAVEWKHYITIKVRFVVLNASTYKSIQLSCEEPQQFCQCVHSTIYILINMNTNIRCSISTLFRVQPFNSTEPSVLTTFLRGCITIKFVYLRHRYCVIRQPWLINNTCPSISNVNNGMPRFRTKGRVEKTFISIFLSLWSCFFCLDSLFWHGLASLYLVISTKHHYSAQIDFNMHEFKLLIFSHALRCHHVFGIKWMKRKCPW